MAVSLFAVNKGYFDDLDIKRVLPFEAGLHGFLKTSHAALLANFEANGAKWATKVDPEKDDEAKKAFKKNCQQAETDLAAAIADFKKSF